MAEEKNGNGKRDEQNPDDGNPDESNPEYENFQSLLKQVLSVPKQEIDKRWRKERQERQAR